MDKVLALIEECAQIKDRLIKAIERVNGVSVTSWGEIIAQIYKINTKKIHIRKW